MCLGSQSIGESVAAQRKTIVQQQHLLCCIHVNGAPRCSSSLRPLCSLVQTKDVGEIKIISAHIKPMATSSSWQRLLQQLLDTLSLHISMPVSILEGPAESQTSTSFFVDHQGAVIVWNVFCHMLILCCPVSLQDSQHHRQGQGGCRYDLCWLDRQRELGAGMTTGFGNDTRTVKPAPAADALCFASRDRDPKGTPSIRFT